MSSYIRKRVRGLLKTTFSNSSNSDSQDNDDKPSLTHPLDPSGILYDRILNGKNGRKVDIPETYSGKTGLDLPVIHLAEFKTTVKSCYTGPDGGLTQVGRVMQHPIVRMANLDDELSLSSYDGTDEEDNESSNHNKQNGNTTGTNLVASKSLEALGFHPSDLSPSCSTETFDWTTSHAIRSFGASTSLYERHPISGAHAGTPVADVFGIISRENNAILALADGVNWGEGSRLAARCAIRGALDHLNNAIEKGAFETTTDIFHSMLGAFHAGHALILQEGGALTTLCVAIVAPMRDSNEYALCVCNVGDSLCFVYNPLYGVREVTLASHDIGLNRDMRDAGGALGPVDGRNPQLHNLTCSMTFLQEGDLVFITSDGISDNFDPVVGKFCVIKQTENEKENMDVESDHPAAIAKASQVFQKIESIPKRQRCNATVPSVDAWERHELMLLRMADVIANGVNLNLTQDESEGKGSPYGLPSTPESGIDGTPTSQNKMNLPGVSRKNFTTASEVCKNLISFATQLSSAKRRTLENPELYRTRTHSRTEERVRRKMVRNMIMEMPGKLDHASVVAYKVGEWEPEDVVIPPKKESKPTSNIVTEQNPVATTAVTSLFCRPTEFHSTGLTLIAEESEHVKKVIEAELQQPRELPLATPTPRSIDGTRSPYEELPDTVDEIASPTRVGRFNATTKKPKKHHGRGSAARHTLGVDVAWLKRLVTSRTTSPADGDTLAPMHPPLAAHSSQMNSQASVAETPTTPMSPPTGSRRQRPSYAPPEVPRPFSFRKFFIKPPKPPVLPSTTLLRSPNKVL